MKRTLACCALLLGALPGFAGIINPEALAPRGASYDATVPDTLDLAERARLSVHGLTSFLNPAAGYAPYGHTYLNANPPYMSDMPGGPPNWGKIAESLLMARVMCGSEENAEVMAKTFEGMLASSWMAINPVAPTPVSRAMLALMAAHQLDPNPELRQRIAQMADEHVAVATFANGYAYYCDLPEDLRETSLGVFGHWMEAFVTGCAIRPLSRWATVTGDAKYMDHAGKLAVFLRQPKYWQGEAEPKAVVGSEHGHFSGHHHSYTQALMGLLWYADATNDAPLKEFVRAGYEYMRNFGIARIGLFGEGCTTGDMTWLALKLSRLGVGDYWDDADGYIRNHLAELQITDEAKLQRAVDAMPAGRGKNDTTSGPLGAEETTDNVVARNVGVFLSDATHPALIPDHSLLYTICCTGNCTPALYAAWESIVQCEKEVAQVNLLLNRVSPWLDVDSHLPFEGKVVIRNKSARKVSVRIPLWVDKPSLQASLNEKPVDFHWLGRYACFDSVSAGDMITLSFPISEVTETHTLKWRQTEFWKESTNPGSNWPVPESPTIYTCTFRGNTLVDITPRDEGLGYPLYQRDALRSAAAPMKPVRRFVAERLLDW